MRKSDRLAKVLSGEKVAIRRPGNILRNLFSTVTKGMGVTDSEWNTSIKEVVALRVKQGLLRQSQAEAKPGNLNAALTDEKLSWSTFFDGITLVAIAISKTKKIVGIRFSVEFDVEESPGRVRTSRFEHTLHGEDSKD